jgi:hypothetical protein
MSTELLLGAGLDGAGLLAVLVKLHGACCGEGLAGL